MALGHGKENKCTLPKSSAEASRDPSCDLHTALMSVPSAPSGQIPERGGGGEREKGTRIHLHPPADSHLDGLAPEGLMGVGVPEVNLFVLRAGDKLLHGGVDVQTPQLVLVVPQHHFAVLPPPDTMVPSFRTQTEKIPPSWAPDTTWLMRYPPVNQNKQESGMISCRTSNRPCLLVRVLPSMVQKLMSGYLNISQLLLLLPVPHTQDVVVGVVRSAEEGAAVLRENKDHAADSSVEHTHPDHMQRVEAHRVPHTHVRSQQLDTGEQSVNIYTNIWEDIAISLLLVHKKLTKFKKQRRNYKYKIDIKTTGINTRRGVFDKKAWRVVSLQRGAAFPACPRGIQCIYIHVAPVRMIHPLQFELAVRQRPLVVQAVALPLLVREVHGDGAASEEHPHIAVLWRPGEGGGGERDGRFSGE
ncbi:hypothetical protein F7725_020383, partial [Dissostichus mawsoni]